MTYWYRNNDWLFAWCYKFRITPLSLNIFGIYVFFIKPPNNVLHASVSNKFVKLTLFPPNCLRGLILKHTWLEITCCIYNIEYKKKFSSCYVYADCLMLKLISKMQNCQNWKFVFVLKILYLWLISLISPLN